MTYRDFLLGSVALASLVIPGVALAQDAGENFSWNGAYIGADVGLGTGSTLREYVQNAPDIIDEGEMGSAAPVGGVFAGYDFEVAPGLVFGIEAGLDFFNSEANLTDATFFDSYEFRSLGAAHAGIRAGVEIAPRTLMYGRLAYAAIHAQTSDEPAQAIGTGHQDFLNGYQAAIGMESEVTDNVTLRVEGTYTKATDSLPSADTETFTPSHFGAEVGVAYRFGGESRGQRVDLTPTRSWSGGYAGVMAGGLGTSSIEGGMQTFRTDGPASDIVGEYGAYMGVNLQVGDNWVVGVEGELSKYDAAYDALGINATWNFATSDLKGQASARLGYLINPDTLLYARAGYGLMHINPDLDFAFDDTQPDYIRTASAGLGVETMVNEHTLVRVEGLYNAALEQYRFVDDSFAGGGAKPFYVEPNSVEARVGAAFMF